MRYKRAAFARRACLDKVAAHSLSEWVLESAGNPVTCQSGSLCLSRSSVIGSACAYYEPYLKGDRTNVQRDGDVPVCTVQRLCKYQLQERREEVGVVCHD